MIGTVTVEGERHTLKFGMDEDVLITENGWLTHARNVVPHAKSQSVRLEQGPLQRKLGLADVHVDTPKGPVHAVARLMDATQARPLVLSQLDRARAARRADRERASLPADERSEQSILDHFDVERHSLLGGGGEAHVYALDDDRVLRIYHPGHDGTAQVIAQLPHLKALLEVDGLVTHPWWLHAVVLDRVVGWARKTRRTSRRTTRGVTTCPT